MAGATTGVRSARRTRYIVRRMGLGDLDAALRSGSPGRTTGLIRLGELPGGSAIDVPYTAVRGREPGSTIWIMAARDGDEVHATLAAMEVQAALDSSTRSPALFVRCHRQRARLRGPQPREHPLAPTYLESQMDDC